VAQLERRYHVDKKIILVVAAIIGLGIVGALLFYGGIDREENSQRGQGRQNIAMTELPIEVQKAIQDNLGGGTLSETAKETLAGRIYYLADVLRPGGEKVEMKIAEDGRLVGVVKDKEDDE
jgi:hypothetical protein